MHPRMRVAALTAIFALMLASGVLAQVVPCSGVILGPAPNQLRAVLQAFCIPTSSEVPFNLDDPVQSAGYNTSEEFVLAYNRVSGSNAIEEPLRVVRLDKLKQTWSTAEFGEMTTEVLPGLAGSCLGAVGDVQKAGTLFYVGISLSPSAGCVAVLSSDLKVQAVLSGWLLAKFANGLVILAGSTRHFAPTHPLRLSLFNPADRSIKKIYPAENDPLRARYIQRLRTEIVPADRCEGENCEIDPERFDDELAAYGASSPALAVNDETVSLAFVVQFNPIGFLSFGKTKDAVEWSEQVVFVCRPLDDGVDCREFTPSEMQTRFGVTSIDALLAPEMLKQVFGR
jgi:hypothetical protein